MHDVVGFVGIVSRANRIDAVEVDVVDVVVEVPVTDKEIGIFFVKHVIGDVGKPEALIFAFFKGGVKVGHARRVRGHRGVFLIGAKSLDEFVGKVVRICEAIAIRDLRAVELEMGAIGFEFEEFEAHRGALFAAFNAEGFNGPVAPRSRAGFGDVVAAILGSADAQGVVSAVGAGKDEQVKAVDVAAGGVRGFQWWKREGETVLCGRLVQPSAGDSAGMGSMLRCLRRTAVPSWSISTISSTCSAVV